MLVGNFGLEPGQRRHHHCPHRPAPPSACWWHWRSAARCAEWWRARVHGAPAIAPRLVANWLARRITPAARPNGSPSSSSKPRSILAPSSPGSAGCSPRRHIRGSASRLAAEGELLHQRLGQMSGSVMVVSTAAHRARPARNVRGCASSSVAGCPPPRSPADREADGVDHQRVAFPAARPKCR